MEEEDQIERHNLLAIESLQQQRSKLELYNDVMGFYQKNEKNLLHLVPGHEGLADREISGGKLSEAFKEETLDTTELYKLYKYCRFIPNETQFKTFKDMCKHVKKNLSAKGKKRQNSEYKNQNILNSKEGEEKSTFGHFAVYEDLLREKSENVKKTDQITELKQDIERLQKENDKEKEVMKLEFMSYKEESESNIKLKDKRIRDQEEEIENLKSELNKKMCR
eukprot:TRINITY_DN8228_c0_g1_i1.p1 TRINITY_DN8228_c0_g1~~TRINITY_DN8228_c0_g1_i1.p1  ORF type:complete len:222 (+),score=46.23 TRINITY_DN8228_c0_g1_i1:97-762(+)